MKKPMMLAVVSCALAFPTMGFAKTPHTKVASTHDLRKIPSTTIPPKRGFILRQDLFDRNDPNNLRSDWPSPPAQPGQL
jgi:hypothetical protein